MQDAVRTEVTARVHGAEQLAQHFHEILRAVAGLIEQARE